MEFQASHSFLGLPRELRDMVYHMCCDTTSRKAGALEDYVLVPSPALLRTCKQIRAEFSSVFYLSLKDIMTQRRVRVKLSNRGTDKQSCCGGWRVWPDGHGLLNLDVFIRTGDSDEQQILWWMDAKSLSLFEKEGALI